MTTLNQDFEIYLGARLAIDFEYDPGTGDPAGATAKLVVLDAPTAVWTGILSASGDPVSWLIAFQIGLVAGIVIDPGPYEYHVCLEKDGAMQVVAKGTMTVRRHPLHPH